MIAGNRGYNWLPATVLLLLIVAASSSWLWGQFSSPAPAQTAIACAARVQFAPQPDITAYELAQIQAKLMYPLSFPVCVTEKSPIPERMQRHFSLLPK